VFHIHQLVVVDLVVQPQHHHKKTKKMKYINIDKIEKIDVQLMKLNNNFNWCYEEYQITRYGGLFNFLFNRKRKYIEKGLLSINKEYYPYETEIYDDLLDKNKVWFDDELKQYYYLPHVTLRFCSGKTETKYFEPNDFKSMVEFIDSLVNKNRNLIRLD